MSIPGVIWIKYVCPFWSGIFYVNYLTRQVVVRLVLSGKVALFEQFNIIHLILNSDLQ